jgi:hypothetical protein
MHAAYPLTGRIIRPVPKLAVVPDLEHELDRLYALPLSEFTQARNDLAARLRQAGQREAAAEVKALRKPTVAAWAVNQLARTRKADVRALVRASERLRKAQAEALSGDSARLREAQAEEREAIRTLAAHARELVPTEATVERVASTLRAAAADPGALSLVEAGRLTEEVEASGFGALTGMPAPKRRPKPKPKQETAAERRRRERIAKLRERARELAAEADHAEREARKAQQAAERARARADEAAGELDEAQQLAKD